TKIGEAETKKLHDKAFINLTHYHYYINLLLDGQVFEPKEASEFTARMHGRNLEYRFTVTLPHPAKKLELSIYDPEFYVDLGPPMQQVTPEKAASVMTTGIYEPKDFLSAGATDGAAPPECGYKKGDPHVSAVWGVFTVFLINCAVKQ
ncbi:MAG: DUF1007 family protein, partial [Alphaproteobacteria bacterium]|nr:DUF1007 family protein [Alphaproteobacteria bacterium]